MINQSCAITGHNPQRFKFKYNEEAPLCRSIKAAITEQIKILYSKGVTMFYVGCAVGVDTWAAEIVIELKKQTEFSDIRLFCAIPFPDHDEKFTLGQKRRYAEILKHCNEVNKKIINRNHSPTAYKRLNYFLVDKTQYLIAIYDKNKNERHGLGQMVNYALKNHRQIIYIHPDTAEVSEHTN
jgi:uncharacterized phage-like protein YoqJ